MALMTICGNPECAKEFETKISGKRKKFCSDKCYVRHSNKTQAARMRELIKSTKIDRKYVSTKRMLRKCLGCLKLFMSESSFNRMCTKCRNTDSFRNSGATYSLLRDNRSNVRT